MAACSAHKLEVLWIFVTRHLQHGCFCLQGTRTSDFVTAGTESCKCQDEIRRCQHFVHLPLASNGSERLWQSLLLKKIKGMTHLLFDLR